MEPFLLSTQLITLFLIGLCTGPCSGENVSLHYYAHGVALNQNFTKAYFQKDEEDCEPCKSLALNVEYGFWKIFDFLTKVKLFERKKSILLDKKSKGVFFSPPSLGGQKLNSTEWKDPNAQKEEMGVYFAMVMELDLNVTDPAVNRRDVEEIIPKSCWMYLRYHSFQLNSTVFVNRSTFGIKLIQESDVTSYIEYLKGKHHFTSRGILRKGDDIPENHQKALRLISYVGCTLSAVGLILTIFTIVLSRKLRRLRPNQILVCLSMSLLAAILLFTFGTNSITGLDSVDLCKALACMLHYFLLSSVVWMSIEAYNLYQDLVKVFDTTLLSHSDFMCRAGVLAWIIPAIVVVITSLAQPDSYGLYKTKNSTEVLCWMNEEAYYGAFLAPVLLLMAVNVTIFVVVMKEIYKLPRMREKSNRLPHLRATISVFVLLGLNWLFAGLAAIVGTLVFHYLFTITCSFQGLFIFLLHGIIKTDFRDAWRALTSKNRVVEILRSRSLVTFSKSLSLSSRHSSSVMPLSGSRLAKQQTKIPGKRSVK
ncbi:adhesion G-protein coupled receptor G6-like [Acropora palmata]|uniref:adhesion G-protein coupled receptor G6-like n=1 Tax=Acropora palmata TaxID=6131 RepID=UPI003D9FF147